MFDWLTNLFRPSETVRLRRKIDRFMAMADQLNIAAGGGEPERITKQIGTLKVQSRSLVLCDPQYLYSLVVPSLPADTVSISADLCVYPSGDATILTLTIALAPNLVPDVTRKIGHVSIDSAKLIIADKLDMKQHWTDVGNDRLGILFSARNQELFEDLSRKFKLKITNDNGYYAEISDPVSPALEKQIVNYLNGHPKYAKYAKRDFRVRTNNSFDRANYSKKPWDFIPIGNSTVPLMFVCRTGHGDGTYDVNCGFADETPVVLTITIVEHDRNTDST